MSKVIVVGGGASGLVASIYASKNGNEVILLEKNNNCGKKILVTGNGKCNYFNDDFALEHYRSSNLEILRNIINDTNKSQVIQFFRSIGIVPKIKNGYYYPMSNQAVSIQQALLIEAKLNHVNIVNNVNVNDVKNIYDKFYLQTNSGEYICDKLVLATGSKAAPLTGSDGFGYDIALKFGHSLIKPLPALVQLKGNEKYFKMWAGIKADVIVSLYEENKKIAKEQGEILLTDYGVSGICILSLSGRVARGLDKNKKEHVEINFIPWVDDNIEQAMEWFDKQNTLVHDRTISQILDGMINYKLVNLILKKEKIEITAKWDDLTLNQKKNLVENLKQFYLKITGVNSFDKAQVCSGGIPLNEVNIKTMESLKQKNLYIVGELLDVDGDCGGYNLGFAWISGMVAGQNISRRQNDKIKTN